MGQQEPASRLKRAEKARWIEVELSPGYASLLDLTLPDGQSYLSKRLSVTAPEPIAGLWDLLYDHAEADARARFKTAAEELRYAATLAERRAAVSEFLAALAQLIICLLRFLVRVLLVVLSRLLGRETVDETFTWMPDPIDTAPQITPRGPNLPFPVASHWGGYHRSTLGSVLLAA